MTTGDVTAGRVLWEAGESPAEFRARLVHYVFAAGGQTRFGMERLDLLIFSMTRESRAGTLSLTEAEAVRLRDALAAWLDSRSTNCGS